ncbi:MAG: hypothetical protein LBH70_04315 [Spirochaetaceae bacterium]|jgi:hypothetical protein|nr:hypothetical protein [Spirochaetaceae bacterium]
MGGSGKNGNSQRKSSRRRAKTGEGWQSQGKKRGGDTYHVDKKQGGLYTRPKWIPIKPPADPLPVPECSMCGKPIKDITSAVADRLTGAPAHFDCIVSQISKSETIEKGDTVTYIGGGRFGVVHFTNPHDTRNFKVKKIIEWEDKGNRADWRQTVADHFSLT